MTAPEINDDEREALEAIVEVMSCGCDGMHASGPLTQELAERLAARGLIDGQMMTAHPEFGDGATDKLGDPIDLMAYWLTPAGELALGGDL
jgi:hypothetical protein